MRANQPMGLKPTAHALLEGLVRVDSGRFYEGYWDERYPLAAYLSPTPALAALTLEREALLARLDAIGQAIETTGQAMVGTADYVYLEYEQDVLYSSGPVMFLALRGLDGRPASASLWSECEMQEASEGVCPCRGDLCQAGCTAGCLDPRLWAS